MTMTMMMRIRRRMTMTIRRILISMMTLTRLRTMRIMLMMMMIKMRMLELTPPGPYKVEPGRQGRLVWITGAPGAGKSSTAQLLARRHGNTDSPVP